MVVRCIAIQCRVYLLSQPFSFHAKQTVILEEPFTSPIQAVANVFLISYVFMIVVQQVVRMVSFLTLMLKMMQRVSIIPIIHHLYVVLTAIQTHIIHWLIGMENIVIHQLIHPITNVTIIVEFFVAL